MKLDWFVSWGKCVRRISCCQWRLIRCLRNCPKMCRTCALSPTSHTQTHAKVPVGVSECVGSRQVSSEVMSQQHHFLQSHLLPPLLQGGQKLILRPLGVAAELGAAAPAEAQQIQAVDRSAAGERVKVLSPKGNPASETMQQHQRSPWVGRGGRAWLCGESYGPQIVAVGYPDVLPGERPLHTWSKGNKYGTEGEEGGGKKYFRFMSLLNHEDSVCGFLKPFQKTKVVRHQILSKTCDWNQLMF